MKLSVVIVNYNVKYFLEQALKSVRKAIDSIDAEVFVVDNNSVDDSVAMVKRDFPEVHLIANKDNPGFSKANNQAIQLAKGEYILLLNPDTVVEEDTFEKVIHFMDSHEDAGGLGVQMIDGKGNFLPESKRGFPSPFVAFCKTFGLSRIFPKSKTFNRYHLGYLDKNKTHKVDVLSGAFMLLRKKVLDKIGLLDETFFMYGEDIDLSYRIIKGGYQNYYFADTTIIHYKGESTKKGSLNYVKVFYNAMIIFAKKHFKGEKAWLFVLMLQMAIYFRAFLTIVSNLGKTLFRPLFDAALIFLGLYLLKDFWAVSVFKDPNYYPPSLMRINAPMYTGFWLLSIFFSGGYDHPFRTGPLVRAFIVGTVFLAAVYGFLPQELRTSRSLILLGAIWGLVTIWLSRLIEYFIRHRNINMGRELQQNLVIVGDQEESHRVHQLLLGSQVDLNLIGMVSPNENQSPTDFLGNLNQLDELVHIYKINEIVFCAKDVSSQKIMHWMTQLGTSINFKIVPEKSLSIIGSNSKNAAGDLYTIDLKFNIATPMNRRNKRLFDLGISLLLLISSIFHIWFIKKKGSFFGNIFSVLLGKKTWIGYAKTSTTLDNLPKLKNSVLHPTDALRLKQVNEITINRLNYLYAKDYTLDNDLHILLKGFRNLGNS